MKRPLTRFGLIPPAIGIAFLIHFACDYCSTESAPPLAQHVYPIVQTSGTEVRQPTEPEKLPNLEELGALGGEPVSPRTTAKPKIARNQGRRASTNSPPSTIHVAHRDSREDQPTFERLPSSTKQRNEAVGKIAEPSEQSVLVRAERENAAHSKSSAVVRDSLVSEEGSGPFPIAGPYEATKREVAPVKRKRASEIEGMDTVDREALKRVRRGVSLGDRGAFFSARAEFVAALRMITQALDTGSGPTAESPHPHSRSLAQALRALDEAEEFFPQGNEVEAELDLGAIIESHETTVLKERQPRTSLVAAQQYLDYVAQKLEECAAGDPVASRAVFGLGKAYRSSQQRGGDRQTLQVGRAMALHQAAFAIDPSNVMAVNELGVLHAEFGQWEQAKDAFLYCVKSQPDATSWKNLAAAHAQLNEHNLARLALQEAENAKPSAAIVEPLSTNLVWVKPEEFQTFGGPRPTENAPATARKGEKSFLRAR